MAVTRVERERNLIGNGARLLLIGGILAALGIVVMVIADGLADGIGVAIASLATVPTVGGLGMWLSGLVERRSRRGKPFA